MVDIHLVFNQFDDRQDEVGIAQPAEHIVEDGKVFVLHSLGDAMRERCEHHARNVGCLSLNSPRHTEGIIIGCTRHTDNQVESHVFHCHIGLLNGTHLSKRRRVAHTQFGVFLEYLLVNTPIVLKHEGIVRIGDNQHIEDAACHQVDERDIFQIKLIPFVWYLGAHILQYISCKNKQYL